MRRINKVNTRKPWYPDAQQTPCGNPTLETGSDIAACTYGKIHEIGKFFQLFTFGVKFEKMWPHVLNMMTTKTTYWSTCDMQNISEMGTFPYVKRMVKPSNYNSHILSTCNIFSTFISNFLFSRLRFSDFSVIVLNGVLCGHMWNVFPCVDCIVSRYMI